MATSQPLLDRIRGEYREMPGLQLTLPQACRLWNLDIATCTAVLDALVVERFLHRSHNGYMALPSGGTPSKAALPGTASTYIRARSA